MSAPRSVLVTGGAGFIGSHVCEALVAAGARVRVLDDFSTGRAINLAHLSGAIEIVEGSIESVPDVARAIAGVSSIVHLAARSSVAESMTADALYRRVNVDGTARLLDAARAARVGRVVFAASSSAYGDHHAPHDESMEPRPMSPYAATKVEGERLVRSMASGAGASGAGASGAGAPDAVALRFFNVYGARQDPTSAYAAVIPRFLALIAAGRPVTIFGDGEQTRDFIHARDAARAVLAAIAAPRRLGGAVMNVGTGRPTTIRALAEMIGRALGRPVAIEFAEARAGEVRHSYATVEVARERLGFATATALEEGLAIMATGREDGAATNGTNGAGYVPGTAW